MIQLIAGREGAGKTKSLVDKANALAKTTDGHIVYVDVDRSQIFRLDKQIRFIDSADYPLETSSEFFGFVCGILSQDYDIKTVFIDGLMKNAKINPDKVGNLLEKVIHVADRYSIDFIISLCCDPSEIPEAYREYLV
jgi:hypothetical protein